MHVQAVLEIWSVGSVVRTKLLDPLRFGQRSKCSGDLEEASYDYPLRFRSRKLLQVRFRFEVLFLMAALHKWYRLARHEDVVNFFAGNSATFLFPNRW